MKIEGNRPNLEATATARADQGQPARGWDAAPTGVPADRVALSSEAATASRAMHAVSQTPDIRQDVVDQARAKLIAGELGANVEALADRMIDAMLES